MKSQKLISLLRGLVILILFMSCKTQVLVEQNQSTAGLVFIRSGKIQSFDIDKFGQFYTVDIHGELSKSDSKGTTTHSFSSNTLGELKSIDVSNPLKVLLFYRDFQHVVFLDNTLSETGRYSLDALGALDVSAVGLSNENNMWIYDPSESKLKKIDQDGNPLISSSQLVTYLGDLQPEHIIEAENYVIINDPDKGLYLFDTFGNYINSLKYNGIQSISTADKQVRFVHDGKYIGWNMDNYTTEEITIPELRTNQVRLLNGKIYYVSNGDIRVVDLRN